MKTLFLAFCTFSFFTLQAQVGIGTTDPQASLDIQSSNESTPASTDGILIPQSDAFPLTNPTANQDGMLLYITGDGVQEKGFYYWNWIDAASSSWISVGTVSRIDDLIDAKSDNDGTNNGSSVFLGIGAGEVDDATDNASVGVGFRALYNSQNTAFNVAVGYSTLYSNTVGYSNTAVGTFALRTNTEGHSNTGIGISALNKNTTGIENTATGAYSLFNNTIGKYNTANGQRALHYNTEGDSNTATGYYSLNKNEGGDYNTASGIRSLLNNTEGSYNVATGTNALRSNTEGNYNVAVGSSALYNTLDGENNVGIGYQALYDNVTGSNNVAIGRNAGYLNTGNNRLYIESSISTSSSASPLIYGEFDTDLLTFNGNVTISNANATHTNATLSLNSLEIKDVGSSQFGVNGSILPDMGGTYTLGNNSGTGHWDEVVANTYTTFSDKRAKHSIVQIPYGLEAVLSLNPVTYRYNNSFSKDNRFRLGLIAQEVEGVIPEVVFNQGVNGSSKTGENSLPQSAYKSMSYMELVPVLIKAIQEQNDVIKSQAKKLDRLDALESKLQEIEITLGKNKL